MHRGAAGGRRRKRRSVNRLDGKVDKWAPRYLPMAWPLHEHAYRGPGFTVKITDLGGGKLMAYSSI